MFSLNKDGSNYKVLHHFKADGRDGQNPQGELVEGRYGALYGTTRDGGKYDKGTIFKLSKNRRGYYVIHHFEGGPHDGAHPQAGLIRIVPDSPGVGGIHTRPASRRRAQIATLYGTTFSGGAADVGTVFRIKETGQGYTILSSFTD